MSGRHPRQSPAFLFRLWHPLSWPRWIRRTFVLLLPLALPVWILLNLAGVAGAFLRSLGGPMGRFWNGPQRRYRRHRSYYGYGRGSARSDRDVS